MNVRETSKGLPWEEAADYRTDISGWLCKTCGHFFGEGPEGEQAARYCHAADAPCSCGKRRSKTYTVCDDCRAKRETERYYALEEVDWDGETPLVEYAGDRYLFDADELEEYLDEWYPQDVSRGAEDREPSDEQHRNLALDSVRLCLCKKQPPMRFDLTDLLVGEYDVDGRALLADGLAAEKAVNDWLGKFGLTWAQTNKRPLLASLRRHLGLPAME